MFFADNNFMANCSHQKINLRTVFYNLFFFNLIIENGKNINNFNP